MRQGVLYLLFVSCLFIGGCAKSKIVEDVLMIEAAGYDEAGGNGYSGTLSFDKYTGAEPGSPDFFQATGQTAEQIVRRINEKASLPVEMGQLNLILFGEDLAGRGLSHFVDTIGRNPDVGITGKMAVVDGRAQELLTREYKKLYGSPAKYITRMLKSDIRTGNMPRTNIHLFGNDLYDPSCDPFLPLIGLEKDYVAIRGLALFDGNRYVGHVSAEDMFVFRRMYERTDSGMYELDLSGEGQKGIANIKNINSAYSYEVRDEKTIPSITIHVNMTAQVEEYSDGLNLEKQEAIDVIERGMEKEIRETGKKLTDRFQELGIDPLGLGSKVRSVDRDWQSERWNEMYPQVQIDIQPEVRIVETGTIE